MQLAEFLRNNEEEILQEWEDFARQLKSAPDSMNNNALRDHARGMLHFIAGELARPRNGTVKRNWRASGNGRNETASEAHGGDRMEWGFSLADMVAEFRALRASVHRLAASKNLEADRAQWVDFNEAVDSALAESLRTFTHEQEHQAHLLQSMLSFSSDQSYIFDRKGCILYANRALAESYGKRPQEIIGKHVRELDREFADEVHRQIGQVLETGREYRGDFTRNIDEGDVHVVEYLFAPIYDQHGRIEAIAGNSRDVTARKAWERTLWQHANHDHLTGVPNRRLFIDRLDQDIRMARRNGSLLALLYIDLDKFKEANDHLGHDGGDSLLKQSSERIASCIRETDTLARMGGDEFTVILNGAGDEMHVEAVARAILARLSRPFSINHETVQIAGSIGIAVYPEHGETVETLTANADQAMYAAKHAGGDSFSFHGRAAPAGHPVLRSVGKPHH